MSDILRATSNGYGKQIKSIETQIAAQKNSIEALEKRKTDLVAAKKTIDDQLPPLPAPQKPAVTGQRSAKSSLAPSS